MRTPNHRVRILEVRSVTFLRAEGPVLSSQIIDKMNMRWNEAVTKNPTLFDGPVVLTTKIEASPNAEPVVHWARASYRYRTIRDEEEAPPLAAIFVCVVQTDHLGAILVGQMSEHTTTPRYWQLPGGTLEPPGEQSDLDIELIRIQAADELREEIGLQVRYQDLQLRLLVCRPNGNVGLVFLAPARHRDELVSSYRDVAARDRARGEEPEFSDIAFVEHLSEIEALGDLLVEYLHPIAAHVLSRDTGPRLHE